MYRQSALVASARGRGLEPTTAASSALGVRGFMNAALGFRADFFFAGFAALFLAVFALFAAVFFAAFFTLFCALFLAICSPLETLRAARRTNGARACHSRCASSCMATIRSHRALVIASVLGGPLISPLTGS